MLHKVINGYKDQVEQASNATQGNYWVQSDQVEQASNAKQGN